VKQDGKHIEIQGARVHHLKNISLKIPRNKITVITGVSGSGKSSLAFDTIFAEGQRQYIETLPISGKQLLQQLERIDVDVIRGLQPVVAVSQHSGFRSRRSTVGTLTEIYDELRLLYARAGLIHCPQCGSPIQQQSEQQILEEIMTLPDGVRLMLLAPLIRGQRGQHREVFQRILKNGFTRTRIDGQICEIEPLPELDANKAHTVEAVIDRLVMKEDVKPRLAESLQHCLKLSEGSVIVSYEKKQDNSSVWVDLPFSTLYACLKCGTNILELEPRTFSFNSPYGACPKCEGTGTVETEKGTHITCPQCSGSRLNPAAQSTTIGGKSISEVCKLQVSETIPFIEGAEFTGNKQIIAEKIISRILPRLRFLQDIGLGYLSLDRTTDSLSGGELHRCRLANALGNAQTGVCYILDEPSMGLHSSDSKRLFEALLKLKENGNTVLVVEHDEELMRHADHIIDLGPGGGVLGGNVVAEIEVSPQSPAQFLTKHLAGESITLKFLTGEELIPIPVKKRKPIENYEIRLTGAATHNLKNVDISFPLGLFICITGVSGSGKSSLLNHTLVPAIKNRLHKTALPEHCQFKELLGVENIDKIIVADQSQPGQSLRSNPATYCGFYENIKELFAASKEARLRGYKPQRFGLNISAEKGGGSCETCKGSGIQRVEMFFLNDLLTVCPACNGKRFDRQTLAVKFKEKNIADVLAMTADEAAVFFENIPKIVRPLNYLQRIGLGYLTLGQSAATLSGGESQRVKLAAELSKQETGKTLYVLDEPTSGLHSSDVRKLLDVLFGLVDKGNTVIVIEHQPDVIKCADRLIELGPVGGKDGGCLTCTPSL